MFTVSDAPEVLARCRVVNALARARVEGLKGIYRVHLLQLLDSSLVNVSVAVVIIILKPRFPVFVIIHQFSGKRTRVWRCRRTSARGRLVVKDVGRRQRIWMKDL